MTMHTPGPWRVDDVGVGFEIAAGNEVVAQAQQVYGDHNHKIRRGNARLIAAAPDLLRYLKEARRTLEMWKDVAPAVSLCADIDAAIARATGEQP